MASRAGQKGTLGLIIPEENMPFTEDGTKPDLIINPHAIPSRMTIGQIVESLFGKISTFYGAFGDCTAFQVQGSNYSTYAPLMVNAGFNSSGNQILYNGMTGEQLESDIYIGPTYYMRLKHMVKDKINYRARGPNTMLTRQSVQGRANDGGLRIGEMERDGILAHGMTYFLNESFLVRGDEYFMAVCNKTGAIAIYNEAKNLFISPYADGPINFITNTDGTMNLKNITKFGRSFSILRIPYAFKLIIQELLAMNIQMRIITDDNIDQLLSMTYSNNVGQLLQTKADTNDELKKAIEDYSVNVRHILSTDARRQQLDVGTPELPSPITIKITPEAKEHERQEQDQQDQQDQDQEQPQIRIVNNLEALKYPDVSPAMSPGSPQFICIPTSPNGSPVYVPNIQSPDSPNSTKSAKQHDEEVSSFTPTNSILEVEDITDKSPDEVGKTEETKDTSGGGGSKQVSFDVPETSSNEKKIINL
jgi:hypothetical protein